jgi:endonuclease/exonuclease/phosphatase family metal-dependent hydrolase
VQRLSAIDADLTLLLEWTGQTLPEEWLQASSQRVVVSHRPVPGGTHGLLVLARRERTAVAEIFVPPDTVRNCRLPGVAVRLKVDERWWSVVGIHTPPPFGKCRGEAETMLTWLAGLIEDGRLTGSLGAGVRGDPVVIAGDLNMLPYASAMRQLRRRGMVDSFRHTRRRPIGTWSPFPWWPKIPRIDYVLTSQEIVARDCWVVDLPGSDHRAVIVDLDW